jgi:hypothetical protein
MPLEQCNLRTKRSNNSGQRSISRNLFQGNALGSRPDTGPVRARPRAGRQSGSRFPLVEDRFHTFR